MNTYHNPVYHHEFPDPFALKFCGEYWAYCTGIQEDGRCFGILRSRDLVHWEALPGAMEPLPGGHTHYWAPEVVYDNGRFLMYYSVGNEERMHIRVAVAERPAGPFIDSGRRLTTETFAIDPHVLVDDDGTRYLFYATDFLDHSHIGTGTVRDRMLDPFTLAGESRPVTRARYDWHVFDPQRAEKGGVRWHTIEGSFVLKHKRRYYQMFSGGNWQNLSYGVSYAIADSPTTTEEWRQVADGEQILPILRTIPGVVVGPGHNSVVRGPDNQQLYCVYHRWSADGSVRTLAIDPLDWAGERMLVLGPSHMPQPAPLRPSFADYFDGASNSGVDWRYDGGRWEIHDGAAMQMAEDGTAAAYCPYGSITMVIEVSTRAVSGNGGYGLALYDAAQMVAAATIEPIHNRLALRVRRAAYGWSEHAIPLPPNFASTAYHLLRIEVNAGFLRIHLDERTVWYGAQIHANRVALYTRHCAAAFAGFALTNGWQDCFAEDMTPAELGWRTEPNGAWHLRDQLLHAASANDAAQAVKQSAPLANYELVVSARLNRTTADDGGYGVLPMLQPSGPQLRVHVRRAGRGWALVCSGTAREQTLHLPDTFDPYEFQQFRFRKQLGKLLIHWEAQLIGVLDAAPEPASVGLYIRRADADFDSVRVTEIV